MTSIGAWLGFFLHWAMVPVSAIWIYEAAACVALRNWRKGPLTLGAIGAALLLGNAAFGGWLALSLTKSLDELSQPARVMELAENATALLSPDERFEKTRTLAQINFATTGVLTQHWSRDGTRTTYAPSQAEIEARVNEARKLAEARANLEMALTKSYTFAVFALVATIAGVLAARRRSRRGDA